MPWSDEVSVVHHEHHDYWRTWFIDECETNELFGIGEKHRPLIEASPSLGGYVVGTEIFLEDAPYFKHTRTRHRVCGPYRVAPAKLPEGAVCSYRSGGEIILYKESRPECGPWLDSSYVRRTIDGVKIVFKQIASQFGFYPYRFRIVRSPLYRIRFVRHEQDCWLCATRRRTRP